MVLEVGGDVVVAFRVLVGGAKVEVCGSAFEKRCFEVVGEQVDVDAEGLGGTVVLDGGNAEV